MEVSVRKATRADAEYIARHLRKADASEVRASGLPCMDTVLVSYAGSDECFVGTVDGEPGLIFGVSAPMFDRKAYVWALGTDLCDFAPVSMVKMGRHIVQDFLTRYPYLENYCAAEYEKSLRWLKLLGFTIGAPEPWGVNGDLFCKLSISKE